MMLMMLVMILFWGLIISGIIFVVRGFGIPAGPGAQPDNRNQAIEILKERYARGEIDTAEYEEKKRQITG
jgi:putative membrane protein